METSTLTGLSEGRFHTLRVLSGGVMTDILTLLGGGGGAVSSATLPLSISNGVLSIDLSAYSDTAAVQALLANYTLTASLFNGVSVGSGLFALVGNGTLNISLTGTESRAALKLIDTNGAVRDLTASGNGDLFWNAAQVALSSDLGLYSTTAQMNAALALKQGTLAYISEGTALDGQGSYVYPASNNQTWALPYVTAGPNFDTLTGAQYFNIQGVPSGVSYVLTLEMRSEQLENVVLSVGDTTSIAHDLVVPLQYDWQAYSFEFSAVGFTTGNINIHVGWATPNHPATPISASNTLLVRNVSVQNTGSVPHVSVSQLTTVDGDVRLSGSLVNVSDAALKSQVQTVDPTKCLEILAAVEPKVYERSDLADGNKRIGFLAQDISSALAGAGVHVHNLVNRVGDQRYLTLDYGRLVSIVWGVCRSQEERIQALEATISGS